MLTFIKHASICQTGDQCFYFLKQYTAFQSRTEQLPKLNDLPLSDAQFHLNIVCAHSVMVSGTMRAPWKSRARHQKVVRMKEKLVKEMKMEGGRRGEKRWRRAELHPHPT